MIEVAQATVTIIPTMKGAQSTITKEMTSTTDTAAEKAGKSSGSKFSSKFSSSIKTGAKVIAGAITTAVASVGALSTSFYNAAKATAEFGDHIDKMSQKMGISTDAYQEWDFIAQHSGTSMDSLKTSMTKLSTAAANGSDAFEKLGISAEEAQSMSREELWNKTITALTGVEDETERARIAQELFGKGATEMGALLNMSAEEIEAMRKGELKLRPDDEITVHFLRFKANEDGKYYIPLFTSKEELEKGQKVPSLRQPLQTILNMMEKEEKTG